MESDSLIREGRDEGMRAQDGGAMEDYESTELWLRTLAPAGDEHDAKRERLRNAYYEFRKAVEPMAGDIARSMPQFTDHSIAHIDALWETASTVMGKDFPINPAEAFVLGGAFLLHDLGMGLVAFPDGIDGMKADPAFTDLVAVLKTDDPSLSDEGVEAIALQTHLRMKHAEQAERLATEQFSRPGRDNRFYLLDNAVLRYAYGAKIGAVARSHWSEVQELPSTLGRPLGAIADLPVSWEVDLVKVACILRLADIMHLDSRRSPLHLYAYRQPTGVSALHWEFQSRMTRPRVVDDRVELGTGRAFGKDESAAWWLAFEAAQAIDRELRAVDALCADRGLSRFQVRSVAGVNDPERFAEFVETAGWQPINAELRATRITSIIESLGGSALYGNRPMVALRELISNAADSVRARRTQFGGSGLRVEVDLEEANEGWMLRVRDNGLGMAPKRMVRALTDFGNSQWTSPDLLAEYPGLATKGYKATGRFGIGFFAAFMVADRVSVRSLKFREASSNTHLLEFSGGARKRPLLRLAEEYEQLDGGGAEVTLWLRDAPFSEKGLFGTAVSKRTEEEALVLELREMCALIDVDLFVRVNGSDQVLAVAADEWKVLDPRSLYRRLYRLDNSRMSPIYQAMTEAFEPVFVDNVEDITDESGDVVARVALAAGFSELVDDELWWWPSSTAGVYVGGMRADSVYTVLGAFVGEPATADRGSAFPVAKPEQLQAWAKSQAAKNRDSVYSTPMSRYEAGLLTMSMGYTAPDLPCAFSSSGLMTPRDIAEWLSLHDEILLVSDSSVLVYYDEARGTVIVDRLKYRYLDLPSNVLVCDMYTRWMFSDEVLPEPRNLIFEPHIVKDADDWDPAWFWHRIGSTGPLRAVLESAASSWGIDPLDVGLKSRQLRKTDTADNRIRIPCQTGGDYAVEAISLRRVP